MALAMPSRRQNLPTGDRKSSCCYQAFEPQFGLDWERDTTTAAMDNSGVTRCMAWSTGNRTAGACLLLIPVATGDSKQLKGHEQSTSPL
ncbi:hypothetical protein RB213_010598, partial [Colletotrichum asianum]